MGPVVPSSDACINATLLLTRWSLHLFEWPDHLGCTDDNTSINCNLPKIPRLKIELFTQHNLKSYKVNLSDNLKMGNAKLVTSEHLCLSQLPSDIPLLATKKPRCPILNVMVFWLSYLVFWNQAVFIFLQNVFSLFFGENVGCKKVVFLKSILVLLECSLSF